MTEMTSSSESQQCVCALIAPPLPLFAKLLIKLFVTLKVSATLLNTEIVPPFAPLKPPPLFAELLMKLTVH